MIGFFDSGFGGLQTMKYFHDLYPDYDYIFLADNENCPFGHKTGYDIEKITFKALHWLFDNGAEIVIIACNTAAAYSIRKRQKLYPEKKTLSITVPGIEEVISKSKDDIQSSQISENSMGSIGILATQATIQSDIYTDLYSRFGGQGVPDFHFVMAPKLVTMVESGVSDDTKIRLAINDYISQFPKDISTLVLGCTHFSVYKKYFQELFSKSLIDPSFYSAKKFGTYLKNHPEIEKKLSKKSNMTFYTTGDVLNFDKIGGNICGAPIASKSVLI